MTFTGTPLTAYAVNKLNVGPAQLNIAGTMLALPWSFKVLYGLLSDCVPIMGKRRKPYFVIGWSAFVAMNLGLASLGEPSLNALIGMGFFSVCGYMLADVMCDAIIVERSKLEPEGRVGHMQSVGYVARYVGNVVGATLGTILYNEKEWHWGLSISSIYLLNGLAAVVLVLPFTYHLSDPNQVLEARSLKEQLGDIWKMVQRRTIYVPMSFIAVYNMLLIPNAAWSNFLILGLKFTPWMLGIMFIVATVFSWLGASVVRADCRGFRGFSGKSVFRRAGKGAWQASFAPCVFLHECDRAHGLVLTPSPSHPPLSHPLGITFYRAFLMPYSWRWVYIISTSLTVFFSVLQLSLIFRLNARWGIPDLIFALGDDAAANFITALQFLPAVTMYIGLCPAGAEGTSYAMLTTLSNVAGAIGSDLGTLMTGIWDVSNTALAAGEWTGLWKLSLLTSLLQPLGLCLLFLLPRDVAHQKAMQKCDKRDWWGGFGFVTFLVVAWTWTIVQTLVYLTTGSSV